jgi:hypothetical protein
VDDGLAKLLAIERIVETQLERAAGDAHAFQDR